MKLGELLVRRGTITEDQLQQALNAQLVYGGHLGTCLIEQGFVSEADLGLALADIFEVGYASLQMLLDVPGPVIECVPRKIVEKHALIPFLLEDGVLHLAMIDPRSIEALDETAQATGLRTMPWVSPEIRIFQAMERYYRIPRRLRFIALCRELDHERPFAAPARPARTPPPVRAEPPKPIDGGCFLGPDVGAEARLNRGLEDLGSEFGYGKSWREIVEPEEPPRAAMPPPGKKSPPPDTVADEQRPTPARPAAPSPAAPVGNAAPRGTSPAIPVPPPLAWNVSLEEATERMCRAEDAGQLANALLDYAAQGTPRCMLWRVEGITASVWAARGLALPPDAERALRVRVTSEPIFRLVAGSGCYRGPVPRNAECLAFYGRLRAEIPPEILLFPLHLDDRLVALFYGDCGPWPTIPGRTADYRRAMVKLAYALAILDLRRSIRAV